MDSQTNYNELIIRQLDRLEAKLEERTRNIVTRSDLEALRKELVAQRELEPQLKALSKEIEQVDRDRKEDKEDLEKRIKEDLEKRIIALEKEPLNRQERFWMRITQIVAILGFAIALFELLAHLKWIP